MIKISEVVEASKRTDISEKYKNIKPVEKMSDQEADDFWASEFEKIQKDDEIDPYDKLLSEAFNRSEDEINIKFDIGDKLLSVLQKFKSENWDAMNEAAQLTTIKELAQHIGEKLELGKIPSISFLDKEAGEYGDYDPVNNVINLNKKYFDNPSELVNTIAHELRHAFQESRAEILDTWEDALYRVNLDNYISPMPLPGGGWLFFTDYMDQYVEVDASAFANLFTEAMRS